MKERFYQLFKAKGVTKAKFAELIGSSLSAISHIMSGRNKPGYDILHNIATVFPDINLNWLIGGNGSMYIGGQPPLKAGEPTLFDMDTPESDAPGASEVISKKPVEPPPKPENVSGYTIDNIPDLKNVPSKTIKQIVFFYSDGSFEDYQKG